MTETPARARHSNVGVYLVLIAANLAVYGSVRHHEFLIWDDHVYVVENPFVHGGLTWSGVTWAFTSHYAANWHPLTWLSHMLDYQLFGLHAGAHHLINLLLHVANTLLLFGVLYQMTAARWRSAVVAALFAIHPLHVESVAWVAERKDVLSTLFWMLTIWAYVRYVRQPRLRRYLLVLLFFGLGLMAKPMVVTLPFVLLLLDYWPLARLAVASLTGSLPTRRQKLARLAALVWEKFPLLALAAGSSVVTVLAQQWGGALIHGDVLPLGARVANALVVYITYINEMMWPTRLAFFYPYPAVLSLRPVFTAALTLGVLSAWVIRSARTYPYLVVGWLWYVGTLVPVIGLVQVGWQSMADRYTYVPLIGLFVMVAWGIPDLLAGWRRRTLGLSLATGGVISALALVAHTQVDHWGSSVTLASHALAVSPGNYQAHFILGNALASQGVLDDAIAHYTEALRINPVYALAHSQLGFALARQGHAREAIVHFLRALELDPNLADAHLNLATLLLDGGMTQDAIEHFSVALRINPWLAAAHNNLGVALIRQGERSEAIAHFSEALRIHPGLTDAERNLERALRTQ